MGEFPHAREQLLFYEAEAELEKLRKLLEKRKQTQGEIQEQLQKYTKLQARLQNLKNQADYREELQEYVDEVKNYLEFLEGDVESIEFRINQEREALDEIAGTMIEQSPKKPLQ